eukprot:Protomagalhaensia_sp_Gyna_25__5780@NODE_845_length_2517_cov_82_781275_g666_i0_p1_GENE_NODE_845_length_2517_cov_82_781275_g666_i0NODE_845_length_2517_cov_82_781275_g666_i0_p1_ORF_typecomplete_len337_score41_68Cyclin_N/PF00134_23/0_0016DUF2271/PF10029_9/0_17_NODE_845_length_2517_cov_82_781275_g666_i01661176
MRDTVIKYERNLEYLWQRTATADDSPTATTDEARDFFFSLAPSLEPHLSPHKAPNTYRFIYTEPSSHNVGDDFDKTLVSARHMSGGAWLKKLRQWFHRGGSTLETKVSFKASALPEQYNPYTLDPESLFKAWEALLQERGIRGFTTDPLGNALPQLFHMHTDATREELNTRFRELHPKVSPTFSLTKLRRLKAVLFRMASRHGDILEPWVALCAWVYFERLVMNGCIHKKNRRAALGTCILVSFKFRHYTRDDPALGRLVMLLSTDLLDRSGAYELEWLVLCELSWLLSIQLKHASAHLVEYVVSNVQPGASVQASFQSVCGLAYEDLCNMVQAGK